jgi:hypothetical protein
MKHVVLAASILLLSACSSHCIYRVHTYVICGNDIQTVIELKELPKGYLSGDTVYNTMTGYTPYSSQVVKVIIDPVNP